MREEAHELRHHWHEVRGMIRHEAAHDKYAMRAAEERADIWHDKAAIATLRHDEDRQEANAIK